jgi:NADPH:quinone reductase
LGIEPKFPYVLGSDGAGTVAAVGEQVSRFKEGDRVYAAALTNPKGGFYAEFTAVKADNVSHVPDKLTTEQAGVMPSDAMTADGVALATRLGADAVVNGRKDDVAAAAREFAPDGLDAALVTAGGETAERAPAAVRDGGRVAYPNGVMPEPKARPGVRLSSYDVIPGQEATDKLNRLIDSGPFEIHVARTFPLDQAAEAHRALGTHFLGKLALRPR